MKIDEMPAGREMDVAIAKELTKVQPRIDWMASTDNGESGMFFSGRRNDVESWITRIKKQYPQSDAAKCELYSIEHYPHYSTDMGVALGLVEFIKENIKISVYEPNDTGVEYICMEYYGGQWNVAIGFTASEENRFYGTANELPLAICRAALKAVGVSE